MSNCIRWFAAYAHHEKLRGRLWLLWLTFYEITAHKLGLPAPDLSSVIRFYRPTTAVPIGFVSSLDGGRCRQLARAAQRAVNGK
jgi:hypothetical protein